MSTRTPPSWRNDTRLNFTNGMTGAFKQTYEDLAGTTEAFIQCRAEYDSQTKRHILTPVQVGMTMPDIFSVRFAAAAAFTAGDRVYIGGREYTPTYTDDSRRTVDTGWWEAGAAVAFSCVKEGGRAYVGNSLGRQIDEKIVVMPQGSEVPVEKRRAGSWYLKVTDVGSGGGSNVRISPNMGIREI